MSDTSGSGPKPESSESKKTKGAKGAARPHVAKPQPGEKSPSPRPAHGPTAASRGHRPKSPAPPARSAKQAPAPAPAPPKKRGAAQRAKGLPKPGTAAPRRESAPPPAPPIVAAVAAASAPGLTEEERIESAKYLPRADRPRVFEEERFIFPENYGVNRVRLLVKDPEWLFAHWDVDPREFDRLRTEVGERAGALSRLTLRITDPGNGGMSVILLPYGARSWYVRTDAAPRAYRAELGITLPSGEFRRLAESNVVGTPRVGPSPERATRVITYGQAREISVEAAAAAAEAGRAAAPDTRPWSAPPQGVAWAESTAPGAGAPEPSGAGSSSAEPGGASDAFRPQPGGASDTFRR